MKTSVLTGQDYEASLEPSSPAPLEVQRSISIQGHKRILLLLLQIERLQKQMENEVIKEASMAGIHAGFPLDFNSQTGCVVGTPMEEFGNGTQAD